MKNGSQGLPRSGTQQQFAGCDTGGWLQPTPAAAKALAATADDEWQVCEDVLKVLLAKPKVLLAQLANQ